ncbi:hypothetical protein TEA_020336 [Camellia sinensis var. sinensis]|uniref:PROP1-like PPR domain-containing protein n=1 Tax=Camellia sinensis var. sinensis TaxID=542762 RepID=A0A4S4D228_CAMSN|nr:hypothetical protein TEA_020336 [Camellia sinensis var. sinensis]
MEREQREIKEKERAEREQRETATYQIGEQRKKMWWQAEKQWRRPVRLAAVVVIGKVRRRRRSKRGDKAISDECNDMLGCELGLDFVLVCNSIELSEWLESTKQLDFVERDYASRLDLIAKVRGLQKAENYIEKIPKSSRGEVIYRTLLANCVSANDVKKTEEVFNKMRDLEFPITCFACNQLLILYRRFNKKKIADVLLLMEKENVKPTLFTYKFLIETKGQSNEITGMDQIFETMKADGIEPDLDTHAILAKHYVSGGLNEKAEAVLKEMEGDNIKEKRWACRALLPLYASLGKSDEVGRIWKVCESNPKLEECMAAILAWGKLKKIEEAEAVFDRMSKTWKRLSSKHYCTLLKVYADNKMLNKGKDLVKRMVDSGSRIDPLTLDALVRLYVGAGEVEKADSILQKAIQQSQMKPMFGSYMSILDQYAKRGDIHNSEKMFHRMRQVGFVARLPQFQALLQAYVNAKAPAYGIRERMKADNVFPNKVVAGQLAQVEHSASVEVFNIAVLAHEESLSSVLVTLSPSLPKYDLFLVFGW